MSRPARTSHALTGPGRTFGRIAAALLLLPATLACAPGVPSPPDAVKFPEGELPVFADHPAAAGPLTTTPAPPDFASLPGARMFRSAIRDGAAAGPNFAGRLTVVSWGCGTQCRQFVIVDAGTGSIHDGFTTMWGVEHRLDSDLLIVNPPPPDLPEDYARRVRTQYYRWSGDRLELLGER